MWYRQTPIKSDNEQGEICNVIIELSNSKGLCVRVCCPFLTPSGCSLMCQNVVATFSGSSSVVAFAWAAVRRKRMSFRVHLFLCLEVGLNIRPRGFEVIGWIIRIHKDSLYSTTMYSTCVHPLAYLNRCKYKQPRQSVFFQWRVAKSHQKHDYGRVCSDFNGCLGSWSNHWSGRLYKATQGFPMPCLARCQPRQCDSGYKKPTEDLWAA